MVNIPYTRALELRTQEGGLTVAVDIPAYLDKKTNTVQSAKKTYEWYPSVPIFLDHYTKLDEKNHYEIIVEGSEVKFFMDIDLKVSQFAALQKVAPSDRQEYCVEFVKRVVRTAAGLLSFEEERVNVYTSVDPDGKKFSFHIVMGCYCDNIKKVHQWCLDTKEQMAECELIDAVDESVYEKNKLFRLLGSTKCGSKRTKQFVYGYSAEFEDSLISEINPKNYEKKDYGIFEKKRRLRKVQSSTKKQKVSEEEFELNEEIKEYVATLKLSIDTKNGNIVTLGNTGGYVCPIHNRVHEAENPYLILSETGFYFDCRRILDNEPVSRVFKEYANKSKLLIKQQKIDKMSEEKIPKNEIDTPVIEYDFKKYKTIIVGARMMLGKTNALISEIVKDDMLNGVHGVIITSKITSSLDTFKKYSKLFKVNTYKTHCRLEEGAFLIIQYDSLWRLAGLYGKKKKLLVICDEAESIMTQSNSNQLKMSRKTFNVFYDLCRLSKYLVLMDAHVGFRSLNFVDRLKRNKEETIYLKNSNQYEDRNATVEKSKLVIMSKILEDVQLIKKEKEECTHPKQLFICTDSIKESKIISDHIDQKTDSSLKILTLNSDCTDKDRSTLEDVNNTWNGYDVIICTSTVGAGISYEKKGFYRAYGMFSGKSIDYLIAIQMLGRVRDISTNEYVLYFQSGQYGSFLDQEQVEKSIVNDEIENPSAYSLLYDEPLVYDEETDTYSYVNKDPYYYNYVDNRTFKSINDSNFKELLLSELANYGFKIAHSKDEIDSEKETELKQESKEIRQIIATKDVEEFKNAEDIDEQEYDELKKSVTHNKDEKLKIEKFEVKRTYGLTDISILDKKKVKKLRNNEFKTLFVNMNKGSELKIDELVAPKNETVIACATLTKAIFNIHDITDTEPEIISLVGSIIKKSKIIEEVDKFFVYLHENKESSMKNLNFDVDYRNKPFKDKMQQFSSFLRRKLGMYYKAKTKRKNCNEYILCLIDGFQKEVDKIIIK